MSLNAFKGLLIEDDDEEVQVVVPKPKPAPVVVAAPAPVAAAPVKKQERGTSSTYTPGEKKTFRPRNSDDAQGTETKRAPRPRSDRPPREEGAKNERQSHDGRGQASQVKRGGRGKANWGNAEDELNTPIASQASEAPEAEKTDAAAEATPVEAAPIEAAPAEPEGPKTFTLAEFKKQQAAAAKPASKPLRQANEGSDVKFPEPLPKKEDEKVSVEVKPSAPQRSARKQFVDVTFGAPAHGEFSSSRGRGGRGGSRPAGEHSKPQGEHYTKPQGEGENRPARGRGGARGGRGGSRSTGGVPDVASVKDFPKL